MLYTLDNGKKVAISDDEIKHSMAALDISKEEAIELWLDDNGYTTNEEQNALDEKAKKVKVSMDLHKVDTKKSDRKPRTINTSDEKQLLFKALYEFLTDFCAEDGRKVEILNENKLFSVKINEKSFKIDVIQSRK